MSNKQIKAESEVTDHGKIIQRIVEVVGDEEVVTAEWVVDTMEMQVQQGLITLGWKPPQLGSYAVN